MEKKLHTSEEAIKMIEFESVEVYQLIEGHQKKLDEKIKSIFKLVAESSITYTETYSIMSKILHTKEEFNELMPKFKKAIQERRNQL